MQVSDYPICPGVRATCGSGIGRIGVIAHETGHFFGLSNRHDTDRVPGRVSAPGAGWPTAGGLIADSCLRRISRPGAGLSTDVTIDSDVDGNARWHDADDDDDGLAEMIEPGLDTDPLDSDTDDDGLADGFEDNYDPNPPDSYTAVRGPEHHANGYRR